MFLPAFSNRRAFEKRRSILLTKVMLVAAVLLLAATGGRAWAAGICYAAHVQGVGWQPQVCDGQIAGTEYQGKRMEAIKIMPPASGGSVCYQAYLQDTGWQASVCNGAIAGTVGQGRRIEALKVWLTGAPAYSVCYRAHEEKLDWGPTACDGAQVGTIQHGLRMEAIRIDFVAAGQNGSGQCYVAFVHGSGEDDTAGTDKLLSSTTWINGSRESYWNKPDHRAYPTETAFSLTKHAARLEYPADSRCIGYRVGYNGNVEWWNGDATNPGAAWQVAKELNDFISSQNIPDGRLIIVTHSMGGLVVRWILNQGVANAPYFNYNGAEYDRIVRKTKYAITIQAPHAGSMAADSLYGEADHAISNAAGYALLAFGVRTADARTNSLRRGYMESAALDAGWMADGGRTTKLYTVGSVFMYGTGDSQDDDLQTCWEGLCLSCGLANLDCGTCGTSFQLVGGDGLVEGYSAHGNYRRRNAWLTGARAKWLDIGHNHNQGRFDRLSTTITDSLSTGGTLNMNAPLGEYIGAYGMRLPQSAVDRLKYKL
jgi:hypothetical protein